MKATIMQPTYLPWMGYFEMIDSVDTYVVLDHVQFEKKSWQCRNRIKTANGELMLTIPTKRTGRDTKICDVEISYDNGNPLEKHWKTISYAYKKAPCFDEYKDMFEQVYLKNHLLLRDLNVDIILLICKILRLNKKVIYSSSLDLSQDNINKSEKVVDLCKKLDITYLYDAYGAKEFIDVQCFNNSNISVKFQYYEPRPYNQLHGKFVSMLSIIDLLFNEGKNSINIIRNGVP